MSGLRQGDLLFRYVPDSYIAGVSLAKSKFMKFLEKRFAYIPDDKQAKYIVTKSREQADAQFARMFQDSHRSTR